MSEYYRKYETNDVADREAEQIGVGGELFHGLAIEHNDGENVAQNAKKANENAHCGDHLRQLGHDCGLIEALSDVVQIERTQRELDAAKIEIVVVYRHV